MTEKRLSPFSWLKTIQSTICPLHQEIFWTIEDFRQFRALKLAKITSENEKLKTENVFVSIQK